MTNFFLPGDWIFLIILHCKTESRICQTLHWCGCLLDTTNEGYFQICWITVYIFFLWNNFLQLYVCVCVCVWEKQREIVCMMKKTNIALYCYSFYIQKNKMYYLYYMCLSIRFSFTGYWKFTFFFSQSKLNF